MTHFRFWCCSSPGPWPTYWRRPWQRLASLSEAAWRLSLEKLGIFLDDVVNIPVIYVYENFDWNIFVNEWIMMFFSLREKKFTKILLTLYIDTIFFIFIFNDLYTRTEIFQLFIKAVLIRLELNVIPTWLKFC